MTAHPPSDEAPAGPIGLRMLRVEDRPLLTGAAEFVDDVSLDGMLHARFVRSPVAHGRIASLDVDAARSLPGVAHVVTAENLDVGPLVPPLENALAFSPPRPLLARAVVRFAGEAVAVVVADTPYVAEDAAEAVGIEIEPLPVLVDPLEAADAEPLHDHDTNVIFDNPVEVGDVDAAFARASVVVERTLRNPRYCATPIETRGAVAAPDGDGVRLWASTQAPHSLAGLLAELLGVPRERVRVTTTDVGGGFGQKAHAYPEEVVLAWLALRLGRPVKWTEDRSENLLAASHARDQVVRIRAAADPAGRLLALDADVVCDVGAYGVYPHGHLLEPLGTPAMIPGPYRLRDYRARSRAVATNKCPEGAYRGVGLPVSAFVHERVMDLLAEELGIDRAEVRRRNYVPPDEMPYTTVTQQRYDSGDYALALRRALEAIGYDDFPELQRTARDEGRLLGLGLASYVEYTGMGSDVFHGRGMVGIAGSDGASMRLEADGGVSVWTTLPAIGQGTTTTFAQLAAAALGVDVERVSVKRSDTAVGGPDGTGTFASRSAVSGGGAVAAAAEVLRRRLLEGAAEALEANVDDLELLDDRVAVRGSAGRGMELRELVANDPDRYAVDGSFDPPWTAYPYATHACIVEVDRETGRIEILRYVIAEDCGRIINPLVVDGQAHGAAAQGIGGALHESIVYGPDGQLVTASLMDYLVPTAAEIPALELSHLEIPAPDSPNGAKGVGEGGTLAPPAALANAVSNALEVELNELPLRPDLVWEAAAGSPGGKGNTRSTQGSSPHDAPGRMSYDRPIAAGEGVPPRGKPLEG